MSESAKRYAFFVEQDGMVVAEGEAPDAEGAQREAMHYAMMYAQDGPIKIRFVDDDAFWALAARAALKEKGE